MALLRPLVVILALGAPLAAAAQQINNFQGLADRLVGIINAGTGVLLVGIILVYFWGLAMNINKFSEEGMEKVRAYFFWGFLAIFLTFAIWGILNLLQSSVFPNYGTF